MRSVDDIHELKEFYINKLYSQVRTEQETDQEYRDDTFKVTEVRKPHKLWRSGIGARMVDAPAEQIVTSNPQVYFEILKGRQNLAQKLSSEVNQSWVEILRLQNPNPFKESVKNKLARGESYIRLCHNERWVTKPIGKDDDGLPIFDRRGLPILFLIPDPMVVYGSPEEDDCGWIPNTGVPNIVIVAFKRQYRDVIVRYPSWKNPKKRDIGEEIEWFEFHDKDTYHCEADSEVVIRQPNPYRCTPFIRKYSGFGRRSPDGGLVHLIVSDIRLSRDLIKQECITRSNIASIEQIFAHKPRTIISPGEISKEQLKELSWGAYDLNVLSNVPPSTTIEKEESSSVPPEMYQNLANIRNEIVQRNPFVLAGFPFGSSGRQQSMSEISAFKRYDTVVENTEVEWATAIEMALQIADKIPKLRPEGIPQEALGAVVKVNVSLKAKDPIEEDRLITMGDRLRRLPNPAIDLETFHTEFMGKTQDESQQIIAKMLADMVTINNPDWAAVMGMVAAEEGSMGMWLEKVRARMAEGENLQGSPIPKTTQERAMGEVQTEQGMEYPVEENRGARQPPERFVRGGY